MAIRKGNKEESDSDQAYPKAGLLNPVKIHTHNSHILVLIHRDWLLFESKSGSVTLDYKRVISAHRFLNAHATKRRPSERRECPKRTREVNPCGKSHDFRYDFTP